jgi:hypothetical protein
VTGHGYDWRLIQIHYSGTRESVRVFTAFDRPSGYDIDWEAVGDLLAEGGAGEEEAG